MIRIKTTLIGSAAAIAFVSSAAAAQALVAVDSAQSSSVETLANADATNSTDIIVTAQRRAERAQSIPMAINTASGASLAQNNIKSAVDINKMIPAVLFPENQGTISPYIRGIGNNQAAIGADASNGVYIDGIYYSRIPPITLRLNNVDHIELLKGPQGTLFGRNSTGGLIQVITRTPKPGDDPKAQFSIGYGNYNTVDASAYVSASLGSKVAADISVIYNNQIDGWGKQIVTGQDTFRGKAFAARSKWVFEPSDETRIILTGNYSQSDGSTGELTNVLSNPIRSVIQDGSGALAPIPTTYYNRMGNRPYLDKARTYGGNLRIEQKLPFANLVSITAYNNLRDQYSQDVDNSNVDYFWNRQRGYERRVTQELQLLSKDGSSVQWAVGGFFLRQSYGYSRFDFFGPYVGGDFSITSGGRTKSYAGYAQATFPIFDKLKLTLGGRYSRDNLMAGGNLYLPDGTILVPYTQTSKSFGKFIWKGVLNYEIDRDILIYASQSRGSKTGQYNIVPFSPTPVGPETLDAYEIGFKSELLDRRLRLNGSIFYYKLKDLQVQEVTPQGAPAAANAGRARIKGLELDASYDATPDFTIRGAISLLDAKFTSFPSAQFNFPNSNPPFGLLPAVRDDASGNHLAQAPGFAGNAGFRYRLPVGDNAFILNGNYVYQSKVYFTDDNFVTQKGYGLVDARLSYQIGREGLQLSVWGSNLTNQRYYTFALEVAGPIGVLGIPGAPRRYGVSLDYKFN